MPNWTNHRIEHLRLVAKLILVLSLTISITIVVCHIIIQGQESPLIFGKFGQTLNYLKLNWIKSTILCSTISTSPLALTTTFSVSYITKNTNQHREKNLAYVGYAQWRGVLHINWALSLSKCLMKYLYNLRSGIWFIGCLNKQAVRYKVNAKYPRVMI